MESQTLSPQVWDQIYKAIRSELVVHPILQGVVTNRDKDRNVVWVSELSSDPIEVVGQAHEMTYFIGGQRKTARVPPAVPEIGDVVLVVRTAGDNFKCVGVLATTAQWQPAPVAGLIANATITGRKIGWNIGSSPPSSPENGDLWIYNGIAGVHWLFVYDPTEATYKWKFVGGPPVFAEVTSEEGTTTTTTWLNLATDGPFVTVARAGEYVITGKTHAWHSVSGVRTLMGFALGNTSPNTNSQFVTAAANQRGMHTHITKLVAAANDSLKMRYYNEAAGTATWGYREILVTPVKVI